MTNRGTLKAGAAVAAALMLNGCVAAVVPVLAGGAIAGTQVIGGDDDDDTESTVRDNPAAIEAASAQTPQPSINPSVEVLFTPEELAEQEAGPPERIAIPDGEPDVTRTKPAPVRIVRREDSRTVVDPEQRYLETRRAEALAAAEAAAEMEDLAETVADMEAQPAPPETEPEPEPEPEAAPVVDQNPAAIEREIPAELAELDQPSDEAVEAEVEPALEQPVEGEIPAELAELDQVPAMMDREPQPEALAQAEPDEPEQNPAAVEREIPPELAELDQPIDETGIDETGAATPAVPAEPVVEAPPVTQPAAEPAPVVTRAPEPAPEPAPPPAPQPAQDIQNTYAEMIGYTLGLVTREPAPDPFESALLRNPTELNGERIACTNGRPTVLIDLDPTGGTLDTNAVRNVNRGLAEGLETLRNQGVEIAWISGRSADGAGAVRRLLSLTGLDLRNEDTLLLLRYAEDRKQTRRRELAESRCLVAIAGDTRSDFDELYDYIRDPAAATALEFLVGDGWFLTPLPLD